MEPELNGEGSKSLKFMKRGFMVELYPTYRSIKDMLKVGGIQIVLDTIVKIPGSWEEFFQLFQIEEDFCTKHRLKQSSCLKQHITKICLLQKAEAATGSLLKINLSQ